MEQWFELEQVASNISFSNDSDSLIWTYNTSGQYSTSSCYSIISFRGVTPVYIPSIWSLVIPPRVHSFLWLLSNNKLMTRDNLLKRNLGKPTCCTFAMMMNLQIICSLNVSWLEPFGALFLSSLIFN
jgi:hypothetical protein